MKFLFILGTRPEAIKLCPLIKTFQNEKWAKVSVCNTGQHKEIIDEVFQLFDISPDFSLDIMKKNQSLIEVAGSLTPKLGKVVEMFKPDWIIVQGDTISTFLGALVGYYTKCKIAHVEAGLRTYDKYSPFPEEINRQFVSKIADVHFAPTKSSKRNLLSESIHEKNIVLVGNTVIDALFYIKAQLKNGLELNLEKRIKALTQNKNLVLITSHRRENFGEGIKNICKAIRTISFKYPNFQFVFSVHPNPNVKKVVHKILGNLKNIVLFDGLNYLDFSYLLMHSRVVLTDSGGVQEEAPSLGIPVIVLREKTERTEAVEAGTVILSGTNTNDIIDIFCRIVEDKAVYHDMSKAINPYGDGTACHKIVSFFKQIQ